MKCTRCQADAAERRDDKYYCARCVTAADWQVLISAIQDARVESPVAGDGLLKSA